MEDAVDASYRLRSEPPLAQVAGDRLEPLAMALPQPGQVALHPGAAEVVDDPHSTAFAQQPVGEVGPDETGSPGHERPRHKVSPRAASSPCADSTLSSAV